MGILNIAFRERLFWVSILVRKRLDLLPVLGVQFGRKGFGYLVEGERPKFIFDVVIVS